MKSKDIKDRILMLAEVDPGGIGIIKDHLGKKEWQKIASHAAGFLSSWFYDQVEELVAPERQLADALAEQLRAHGALNGYARDVLARHAKARGMKNT